MSIVRLLSPLLANDASADRGSRISCIQSFTPPSEIDMDGLNDIIARLEKQKQAIEKALGALLEVGGGAPAAPAAPAKRAYRRRAVKAVKAAKKKGGISAEGRKRLAEAMKKRWALKRAGSAVKKAAKK